jgi:exosome complex component RRP42
VEIASKFSLETSVDFPSDPDKGKELGDALQESLQGYFEAAAMTLIPNQAAWCVFVDCVVLGDDGGLSDALSLAAHCALRDAVVPSTHVLETEDGMDFEVNPDVSAAVPLAMAAQVGLGLSLLLLGGHVLADPSKAEEACGECSLAVRVTRAGRVSGVSKRGGGGMPAEALAPIVGHASSAASALMRLVDEELARKSGPQAVVVVSKQWD